MTRLLSWPATLFGRLALILLVALLAAQALTFGSIWVERSMAARSMMRAYLTRDIASSVAMLERVAPGERADWLARLERNNYRYRIGAAPSIVDTHPLADVLASGLSAQLGPGYVVDGGADAHGQPRLELGLKDGTPLAVELTPSAMPLSSWLPALLAAQLALLLAAAWIAVRVATRPLAQLAGAAQAWKPGSQAARLPETGPDEVARSARSFNAMQERIDAHLQERTRILASIAHDLQTPITRLRLRAELLPDEERERWLGDLAAMQSLVSEGIEYARSAEAPAEPARLVDVDALVAAIAGDYQDAGQAVAVRGRAGRTLATHPRALRRIVANLVDNALKFAGAAEIEVALEDDWLVLAVLDRGPGVPEDRLQLVLQPFYRIEESRNADTGGSGLGLAIADQLARACNGEIALSNRPGGGLCARLRLRVAGRAD